MIRASVTRRELSNEEVEQAKKSAYKNTKYKYFVSIEEYKDEKVWNVITVMESDCALICKIRAQDIALMFNCDWKVLYE